MWLVKKSLLSSHVIGPISHSNQVIWLVQLLTLIKSCDWSNYSLLSSHVIGKKIPLIKSCDWYNYLLLFLIKFWDWYKKEQSNQVLWLVQLLTPIKFCYWYNKTQSNQVLWLVQLLTLIKSSDWSNYPQ